MELLKKSKSAIDRLVDLYENTLNCKNGDGYEYGVFPLSSSVRAISILSKTDYHKEYLHKRKTEEDSYEIISGKQIKVRSGERFWSAKVTSCNADGTFNVVKNYDGFEMNNVKKEDTKKNRERVDVVGFLIRTLREFVRSNGGGSAGGGRARGRERGRGRGSGRG